MKFLIFFTLSLVSSLSAGEFTNLVTKALTDEPLETDERKSLTRLVLRKHDVFLETLRGDLPEAAAAKAKTLLPKLTAPAKEDKGQNRLGAAVGWFLQYQGNDMTAFPLITKVNESSPAAIAKLNEGDVLFKLEGESLHHHQSRNHFIHLLMIWPEGTPMNFEIRYAERWNAVKHYVNRRKKRKTEIKLTAKKPGE